MPAKQKITYCLWVNQEAEAVAKFYTGVFKNSAMGDIARNPVDTPSGKAGTVLTTTFTIEGQPFLALNGGSQYDLNPSISFFLHAGSAEEIDDLWEKLSEGGQVLMPLDKYPYSDKYGWVQDKFGLSWQLMLPNPGAEKRPRLMPSLLFVNKVYGQAEEALGFYTSVFRDSRTGTVAKYPAGLEPDQEGKVMYADLMLEGQWFALMESGDQHAFAFNPALSFMVHCDSQAEIDHYWNKLSGEGGQEVQCGWLNDKYGVAWQIVPEALLKLLAGPDKERAKRVMQAMMKMVKLDIQQLEEA